MPSVLFICTHNSARSQMAEGVLRARMGDRFEAASAGTAPGGVHPLAVEAMAEIGIDISGHASKHVDEAVAGRTFDYVVTVCDSARENCPYLPATLKNLHAGFEDPSAAEGTHAERLESFRRVRDQIAAWIEETFGSVPGSSFQVPGGAEPGTGHREPGTVRIGITTSFNEGEQRLHLAYVQAIERAGGLPLIIPMLEEPEHIRAFAELLHGLVITGGPAITEGLVGELPEDISETDPIRIRSDHAVLQAFLDARKPILGICYGMQLLNAAAGGTIYADVQRQMPGILVHSDKRGAERHAIRIVDNSHLHNTLKKDSFDVNSRHIQAVASPGPQFHVAATAPDGVIEAIENEDGSVLGVQFHPERMGDEMLPLFRHLVENARRIADVSVTARELH